MLNSKWFLEFTTDDEASLHNIEEVVFSARTEYQMLEILRLGGYGKCLVLDGKMQSTQTDEFIYHESLVHPSMISMDFPVSVLIAGGGEGATIREALRYPSVEEIYLVDLDPEVVNACKKHLPEWHRGAFDNPKVTVIFEDARKFIENSGKKFDLIILDLPEPFDEGPAALLYTREFYRAVFDILSGSGSMVTQATSTAVHNCSAFLIICKTLKEVFPIVRPYSTNVPSFYSPWGFVFASKQYDPISLSSGVLKNRISLLEGLRFYDYDVHTGLFILPKFLKEAIEKEERVNTDSNPLSFY
ncbi:spermidine synthase [bacterium BMS3Abin07]|nr:spermidine synthase [bacterium BMS3Abin07]GBE32801.1 spermidine synthase [bacterium BMS3Bbin05]HDL20914.1 polyamine aminopropyltransferase [Nitrospirota bacterium]HDO23478.1 polyamine aminopropyltransferase [Nitrospirota bacterium]HDZ88168.1 polyamine aminopropyltransferase [Nitrospirota bacterium]